MRRQTGSSGQVLGKVTGLPGDAAQCLLMLNPETMSEPMLWMDIPIVRERYPVS